MFYPKDDGSLVSPLWNPRTLTKVLGLTSLGHLVDPIIWAWFWFSFGIKIRFHFLKLDFSKAYDKVDWGFLFDCMDKLRIPIKFFKMMKVFF